MGTITTFSIIMDQFLRVLFLLSPKVLSIKLKHFHCVSLDVNSKYVPTLHLKSYAHTQQDWNIFLNSLFIFSSSKLLYGLPHHKHKKPILFILFHVCVCNFIYLKYFCYIIILNPKDNLNCLPFLHGNEPFVCVCVFMWVVNNTLPSYFFYGDS